MIVDRDKNKYKGKWEKGEQTGFGSQEFNDGTSYEGELKNGKKHGNGALYDGKGKVRFGTWKNDVAYGKDRIDYDYRHKNKIKPKKER